MNKRIIAGIERSKQAGQRDGHVCGRILVSFERCRLAIVRIISISIDNYRYVGHHR